MARRKDILGTPRPHVMLDINLRVWVMKDSSRNKGPAVKEDKIEESIDAANQIWAPARIQFHVESMLELDSSTFYEIDETDESGASSFENLAALHWDPGNSWINVYYVRRMKGSGLGDLQGKCSFPGLNESHAVVLEKKSPTGTLAHELGHYFNLEHVWADDLSDTNSEKYGDKFNIMTDFSDKVHKLHLTQQQIDRARKATFEHRGNLVAHLLWVATD